MGLLRKFFGAREAREGRDTQLQSSQFHETESTAQRTDSANAGRRELLQVVLRDTMRRHGIPSDWIDCRILSVVTRRHRAGMHVQFIVNKGQMQLLSSVHDFQRSFRQAIEQFDSRARDWLFSIAWQFDGPDGAGSPAPGPGAITELDTQPQPAGDTQPLDGSDDVQADLRALYAIRDAALAQSAMPAVSATAASPGRDDPTGS